MKENDAFDFREMGESKRKRKATQKKTAATTTKKQLGENAKSIDFTRLLKENKLAMAEAIPTEVNTRIYRRTVQ